MAAVPDYTQLNPEDQAACQRWNHNLTHGTRLPALSNPPTYLQIYTEGYDQWEDFKKELDAITKAAGFMTKIAKSGTAYKRLVCNRGAARASVATLRETSTIKVGCRWQALVSCNKSTNNKWKITAIQHQSHENHGPQEVGGAEKGWFRFTPEQAAYATRKMQDPTVKPRELESDLLREFPGLELGQNTLKNFMADFRKTKLSISKPTCDGS